MKGARAKFAELHKQGKIDSEFVNTYDGGLDNEAFTIRYVDEVRVNAAGTRILGDADIYDFKGITVYRGGANTPGGALNTVSHEFKHLDPRNIASFTRGGLHRKVAERIARRYGDRIEATYSGK